MAFGAGFASGPLALGLAVAAAGLTVAGITTLPTLKDEFNQINTAIQPYLATLSTTEISEFQSTLTNQIQALLSGGMLVQTIDQNGIISNFTIEIPSVSTTPGGSQAYEFSNGTTYMPNTNGGTAYWEIPVPGTDQMTMVTTNADGSYQYQTTESSNELTVLIIGGGNTTDQINYSTSNGAETSDLQYNAGGQETDMKLLAGPSSTTARLRRN